MMIADADMFSHQVLVQREAEILNAPPRIAGVPLTEMSEEQRLIISRVRGAIGADDSSISEYFLILAKRPSLFVGQLEMGAALFNGAIPARERELVILRCGWLARAPYEWGEHVPVAKRVGLTDAEIERVTAGPTAEGWTEHEAALLSAVDELFRDQMISDAVWATLAKSWGDEQLLGLPLLVGQYVGVAMVQNSIRLPLENGNTGLTRR